MLKKTFERKIFSLLFIFLIKKLKKKAFFKTPGAIRISLAVGQAFELVLRFDRVQVEAFTALACTERRK
jgi:hypothetical protein